MQDALDEHLHDKKDTENLVADAGLLFGFRQAFGEDVAQADEAFAEVVVAP